MAQRAVAETRQPDIQTKQMRPIDREHLAKQCLGDEFLEIEVLRLFDKTLSSYLERLKQTQDDPDRKLILHSIKGASAGIGAWGIAELAKSIEGDIAAGHALTPERIGDLGMAAEEVRNFIAVLVAEAEA